MEHKIGEEKILKRATLVFLRSIECGLPQTLLARKTRNIGMDMWNGYGGGIGDDEPLYNAAVRELFEEASVLAQPEDLQPIAVIDIANQMQGGAFFTVRVYVFELWDWQGVARESEEMAEPTWFLDNALPFQQMMPADRVWLPVALSGKKLLARASYTPHQRALIGEVTMEFIDKLPEV